MLLEQYPWFEDLYRDIYTACLNTERVMDMFSEELKILDRNTVQYMIDEMEEDLKKKESRLKEQEDQLKEQSRKLQDLEGRNLMLENVCRGFVSECRKGGGTCAEAAKILSEKTGMDEKLAAEMAARFWEQK